MIYIEPRHKPVFSMKLVREICNFAEVNIFYPINNKYQDLALSLETTCRINELNKKIINCNNTNLDFKEVDSPFKEINSSEIVNNFGNLSQSLDNFSTHLIEYNSPDDLSGLLPGNYLFFSKTNNFPNIEYCHAYFALSNSLKCEVSLNRFEDVSHSTSLISFGAVIV
jgi:hypothetical protein